MAFDRASTGADNFNLRQSHILRGPSRPDLQKLKPFARFGI
jgi:hypothetical protein